jgi:hypothetical protein
VNAPNKAHDAAKTSTKWTPDGSARLRSSWTVAVSNRNGGIYMSSSLAGKQDKVLCETRRDETSLVL